MSTYTIVTEATLLKGRGLLDAAGTTKAHKLIRRELDLAGYTESPGPDLDRRAADPSYIWQRLGEQHQDVLWIEAHGSTDQAITALPLEHIGNMHMEGTISWGRISPRLLVFGSCGTGLSPLLQNTPPLIAYLVAAPVIVVASTRLVRFDDIEPYNALIRAWVEVQDHDVDHQLSALREAAPGLFDTVLLVEPAIAE